MSGDGNLIIVMRSDATREDVDHVLARLAEVEAEAHVSEGARRTVIGIVGDRTRVQQLPWEAFPGVERAVPVLKPFKFVSRDFQSDDSVVEVGSAKIGGGNFAPIAGPCAVESKDQLFASAEAVMQAGKKFFVCCVNGKEFCFLTGAHTMGRHHSDGFTAIDGVAVGVAPRVQRHHQRFAGRHVHRRHHLQPGAPNPARVHRVSGPRHRCRRLARLA